MPLPPPTVEDVEWVLRRVVKQLVEAIIENRRKSIAILEIVFRAVPREDPPPTI